jgi:hypothetical protein
MKARSYSSQSAVETLEGRSMMSAVAEADFNNDGRLDKAVVTSPTTITVSLKNLNGSYMVSAVLAVPKSQPITDVYAWNINDDGKMDILASGSKNSGLYSHSYLNQGDDTFTYIEPFRWKHTRWWV